MFALFLQNGSLVSKNKASKKKKKEPKNGEALLLHALQQELEMFLVVPSLVMWL